MSNLGCLIRFSTYCLKDYFKYGSLAGVVPQLREIRRILADYNYGKPLTDKYLADALDYATKHSAFYKPYAGKPLSEFPIMTKLDISANRDQIFIPQYLGGDLHKMFTSGSTGVPFYVLQNRAKRNRVLAELKYFAERAGCAPFEKMINFRALNATSKLSAFWSNARTVVVDSLSDAKACEIFKVQQTRGLRGILAYPSNYEVLVKKWLSWGLKGNPSVRAIMAGSEMMSIDVRENCQRFWPQATICSRYSNQECGILAQDHGNPAHFELNWASYYFEVLKLDSNEPAAEGELGRIVITDLFNRAFPMIRYDTGDLGHMCRPTNAWPYFSDVAGRRLEVIYGTDGSIVSSHQLTGLLHGLEHVLQWQFIQEAKKQYRIKFIVEDDKALALQSLSSFVPYLKSIFGADANFELEAVDAIPLTAARKFKPVIQKMQQGSA